MTLPIVLIAAVAENGVIGAGNDLPWRLPTDFAYFKRMTLGKPLVMGRKTYESIGKPLPDRANIVISRDPGFAPNGVILAASLDDALAQAELWGKAHDAGEIMIGGGGAIYAATIGRADRLLVTRVHAHPEGDTVFPDIDPALWTRVEERFQPRKERDSADMTFEVYRRRATDMQ